MASAPVVLAAARIASRLRYDFDAAGGPISTHSSASRTASESLSALLWACTVARPNSRAARTTRTAISPRLAIRSLWIVMDGSKASNLDLSDRLAGHHRLFILGEEAYDLAGCARLHLVERLHDFDEADGVLLRDRVAVGFVDRLVRRRLAVEYAWEGRKDLLYGHEVLVVGSLRPRCASH